MLVLPNVTMEPSNVRKHKGTTQYDKSTITCNVETAKCKDETVKCDVLITWYNKLPTGGYHKSFFMDYVNISFGNLV